MESINEEDALARFDRLVSRNEILYEPSEPVIIDSNGYRFYFRLCEYLQKKPQLPPAPPVVKADIDATAKGLSPAPSAGPGLTKSDISNDHPDFHLGPVGDEHYLVLNRFCVFRPQYILLTNDFRQHQSLPLNINDLRAAYLVLDNLKTPNYILFNGGRDAGCSREHKHLQIIPWPTYKPGLSGSLFEENVGKEETGSIQRFTAKLPARSSPNFSWEQILEIYRTLLQKCATSLGLGALTESSTVAHSAVMGTDWIVLIPRRNAQANGAYANAPGMMGDVWLRSVEEFEAWKSQEPETVLATFGVPRV